MGIIGYDADVGKGFHSGIIADSVDDEFVFSVNTGKRCQMTVKNAGGSTFDVIYYLISAEEATAAGITRLKGVLATGITATDYNISQEVGVAELGIEVTTNTATGLTVEVLEAKV